MGNLLIETKRIILRKIKLDDAEAMFNNWASDDDVTKYLMWPTHRSIKDTKDIINLWLDNYKKGDFYQWVMEHKEAKEIFGTIGLFVNSKGELELGYCIGKNYWNQGLTSEASHAVIEFAFNKTNVDYIVSRHSEENPASGRVMQKSKMTYTHSSIEFSNKRNKEETVLHYIIKKEDFK